MSKRAYAVFTESFSNGYKGPTIDEVENYCFQARQRGAQGNTNVKLNDYNGGSFTVEIPEDVMTGTYSQPSPISQRSNVIRNVAVGLGSTVVLLLAFIVLLLVG